MTKYRNYSGGGTLSLDLCTLPKGGGAHDRAKYGCSMPVQDRRLPADRESHTSVQQLAWHKLGAAAGPHADGCQRYLPREQRGRRGTAYADGGRDAIASASAARLVLLVPGWSVYAVCSDTALYTVRQHRHYDISHGWRSGAQQPAALPRGVHLASDSVIPERGCAA